LEKAAGVGEKVTEVKAAIRTLGYITSYQNQEATMASLRRLLCHSSTEKTSKVLKQAGIESRDHKPQPPDAPPGRQACDCRARA
jgi:hypothetical protein